MRNRRAALFAAALLAAASPARAATLISPNVGVTNTDNSIDCRLVNTGSNPVSVLFEILDGDGAVFASDTFEVPAGGARALTVTDQGVAGHCRFTGKFKRKAVRAAIENGIRRLPDAAGRFPQVSGLRFAADLSRPAGQRVTAISAGGAPLDDAKIYKLATNDFMARGGDGYAMLRDAKALVPENDGPLMANEVMVYLRKLGTVRTGVEGRIVLK